MKESETVEELQNQLVEQEALRGQIQSITRFLSCPAWFVGPNCTVSLLSDAKDQQSALQKHLLER